MPMPMQTSASMQSQTPTTPHRTPQPQAVSQPVAQSGDEEDHEPMKQQLVDGAARACLCCLRGFTTCCCAVTTCGYCCGACAPSASSKHRGYITLDVSSLRMGPYASSMITLDMARAIERELRADNPYASPSAVSASSDIGFGEHPPGVRSNSKRGGAGGSGGLDCELSIGLKIAKGIVNLHRGQMYFFYQICAQPQPQQHDDGEAHDHDHDHHAPTESGAQEPQAHHHGVSGFTKYVTEHYQRHHQRHHSHHHHAVPVSGADVDAVATAEIATASSNPSDSVGDVPFGKRKKHHTHQSQTPTQYVRFAFVIQLPCAMLMAERDDDEVNDGAPVPYASSPDLEMGMPLSAHHDDGDDACRSSLGKPPCAPALSSALSDVRASSSSSSSALAQSSAAAAAHGDGDGDARAAAAASSASAPSTPSAVPGPDISFTMRQQLQQSQSQSQPHRKLRVLVVDDSAMNRKMMVRLLTSMGHTCEQSEDGQAACEMMMTMMTMMPNIPATQQVTGYGGGPAPSSSPSPSPTSSNYDVVLMDNLMPRLSGPQAATRMREMGYKGLIVGLSGLSDEAEIRDFQ